MPSLGVPTKTRSKLVGELSAAEYRACHRLNQRHWGAMQRKLVRMRHAHPAESWVVMIEERDTRRLLAWALIFPDRRSGRDGVHFYVRKRYRRHGLGRRLVKAVCRHSELPKVFAWDKQSAGFFSAVSRSNALDIDYSVSR